MKIDKSCWLLVYACLVGSSAAQTKDLKGWNKFRLGMRKHEVAQLNLENVSQNADGSLNVTNIRAGSTIATVLLRFELNRTGFGQTQEDQRWNLQQPGLADALDTIYVRFHAPDPCDVAVKKIVSAFEAQGVASVNLAMGTKSPTFFMGFKTGSATVLSEDGHGASGCSVESIFSSSPVGVKDLHPNPDLRQARPFIVHALAPEPKSAEPSQSPSTSSSPDVRPIVDKDTLQALFAMFYIAQKCQEAHVVITPEMLSRMQAFAKKQAAESGITEKESDKLWSTTQLAAATQTPLRESDCEDVIRFMGMYAPGILQNESPNPLK